MASPAPAIPSTHGWTYQQYLELDDEQRYEIIDGELILSPAPSTRHQAISLELVLRMNAWVGERNLGQVFYAPVDVVLNDDEVVQPDILFIRRENAGIVGERAIHGAPDLAVEILSPSSVRLDRHRKRALYERAGVREFWLVDPANRVIEVFGLREGGYELASFAAEQGQVASGVLEGFVAEVAEVIPS